MNWVRAESPREFFERAEAFLLSAEAEHALLLGLRPALVAGEHDFEAPIYLGWAERDGAVTGVAFRTPPFKLVVGRLPPEVVPALVEDLGRVYEALPAVMGPEVEARAVARTWAASRNLGVRIGMRLRVYALNRLRRDLPRAPGRLRRPTAGERDLVRDWLDVGSHEMGVPLPDPTAAADRMLGDGSIWLHDDGGPVSMAAALGATSTSVRIGYVYTPPEHRGRGYATTAVADLTALQVEAGRRSVFLYTDRDNPTSNALYLRIGFEAAQDQVDVEFDAAGGG